MNQKPIKPSNFQINSDLNNTKPYKGLKYELESSENLHDFDENLAIPSQSLKITAKNHQHFDIKQENHYNLKTHKLSDVKLSNSSGKTPLFTPSTKFIPPNITDGKPIMLIENSQFGLTLCQEAIDELSKYELKTAFLSIIGEKKSGKSLLMNKLLQLPETQGFHKGNNEGLLMWSVPLYLKQANLLIFFIESNVFDNRSEGDDSLMSLMYCISSLIIFNVMGDINYKTMDVIQVMSTMKKKVQEIKIMSPSKNLWVFRDINEKIIKNNNTSQGQMIENRFLDIMKKATNEDKNNLQSFNEVFPEKMCVYCPKVLGYKGVGEEFLKSIENVKGLIEKEIPEKTLEGHSMNARMMLSFINSALEGIRDTNTIDLNFCWSCIAENECITAYNTSLDLYNNLLKEFYKDDEPRKTEEIFNISQTIRDATLEKFNYIAGFLHTNEFYYTYQNKLKEIMNSKELKSLEINEQMNSEKSETLFIDLVKRFENDLQKGMFSEKNITGFISHLNELLETYGNFTQGLTKTDILIKNLNIFNEKVLKKYLLNIAKKNGEKSENIEKQDNKHENELKEAKRNLKTAIEENKEIQSNISKTKETLKIKDEEISRLTMELNSLKNNQNKKSGRFWCCGKK